MNKRTEEKLKSIEGMKNAMTEILAQAWERGRKYGRLEAQESSRGGIMDNKKVLELLKSSHRRDFLCSECQNDADECKSSCEYGQALDHAIKFLENSSWIPVKTRELTAEEVKEVNKKYDIDLGEEAWCICSPLPEDAQEVLITTKYGDVVLTEFCVDDDGCWFDGYEDRGDVLAWMPLPEPYKEENT